MIQVYINKKLIQVESTNSIYPTIQSNEVGTLDNRQATYTNEFKAPIIKSNFDTLEALAVMDSTFGTEESAARISYDGIDIITNGKADVKKYDTHYYIRVTDQSKKIFSKLEDLTLGDIYGDDTFVFNEDNYFEKLTSDKDFIFGVTTRGETQKRSTYTINNATPNGLNNGLTLTGDTENDHLKNTVYLDYLSTPQFYVKDLFEKIFNHLGYTINYDFKENERFKNLLIGAGNTIKGLNINETVYPTLYLKYFLPKIKCSVFVKEILIRFNSFVNLIDENKINITNYENLLDNVSIKNWSNKLNKIKSVEVLGNSSKYGQNNYFELSDDKAKKYETISEESLDEYPDAEVIKIEDVPAGLDGIKTKPQVQNESRGVFELSNKNLKESKTVFKSIFSKAERQEDDKKYTSITTHTSTDTSGETVQVYDNIIIDQFVNFYEKDGEIIDLLKQDESEETLDNHLFSFDTYFSVNLKIGTRNEIGIIRVLKNEDLQNYVDEYYPNFIKSLKNYNKITASLNLNITDLYKLDFAKFIYLKQTGRYYFIEKIKNYKPDKLTDVELVEMTPKLPAFTCADANLQGYAVNEFGQVTPPISQRGKILTTFSNYPIVSGTQTARSKNVSISVPLEAYYNSGQTINCQVQTIQQPFTEEPDTEEPDTEEPDTDPCKKANAKGFKVANDGTVTLPTISEGTIISTTAPTPPDNYDLVTEDTTRTINLEIESADGYLFNCEISTVQSFDGAPEPEPLEFNCEVANLQGFTVSDRGAVTLPTAEIGTITGDFQNFDEVSNDTTRTLNITINAPDGYTPSSITCQVNAIQSARVVVSTSDYTVINEGDQDDTITYKTARGRPGAIQLPLTERTFIYGAQIGSVVSVTGSSTILTGIIT